MSRYLTAVNLTGAEALLLYGGWGGRLVQVPLPFHAAAQALLDAPNRPDADAELLRLFRDHAILVPEEWDELDLLERRSRAVRQRYSPHLSLTICPTLDCNFRCVYCYQRHLRGQMSPQVQDAVVEFVERREPPVESLEVTWFGGEPLLGLPVIEALSARLMGLSDGQVRYRASIITNGWLLTPETCRALAALGVRRAQVTLDGPAEVHDRRRPHANGQPTFGRIVANLAKADPRLSISIRVNVDEHNRDRLVPELFDQLDAAGLCGRVGVYFAPVAAYTEVCADVAGSCVAPRVWSQMQAQLHLAAFERGYGGPALPRSRANFCLADNVNGWVINSAGLVFKCWNDVTRPQHAVRNLLEGEPTPQMQRELARWLEWNPFALAECRDCPALPQCLGGCPHQAMAQPQPIKHGDCDELRYNLPQTVATYYLAERQKESATEVLQRLHEWLPDMVPDPKADRSPQA